MENVKIILDNGSEINVNGIFYVFNSKYYFIYTTGEMDGTDYAKLYVAQVCKEVKNTPTGPVDTGYMLGMEIKDSNEWHNVQTSITKIVEDKKNGIQSPEIQYLPINMLVNLKVVSKNKFKLMKEIVENNFKIVLNEQKPDLQLNERNNEDLIVELSEKGSEINQVKGEVIIDYRTRFFEEQEKNKELQEQIKILNDKLENIKNIIG